MSYSEDVVDNDAELRKTILDLIYSNDVESFSQMVQIDRKQKKELTIKANQKD